MAEGCGPARKRWGFGAFVFLAAAVLSLVYLVRHDPLRGAPSLRDWRAQSTLVTDRHGRWLRLVLAQDGQYRLCAYSVDRGHRFWRSWAPLEREHFGRCDFKHGWSRWVNFGGGAGVPVTA